MKNLHFVITEFPLEIGEIYIVYGIDLWRGTIHYLTTNKFNMNPSWYPAELFEIIDNLLPLEWYYEFYTYENDISAIWGYKELVLNKEHKDSLLERDNKAISIFLTRKQEIDELSY
jgi:hypothetical protein